MARETIASLCYNFKGDSVFYSISPIYTHVYGVPPVTAKSIAPKEEYETRLYVNGRFTDHSMDDLAIDEFIEISTNIVFMTEFFSTSQWPLRRPIYRIIPFGETLRMLK